MSVSPTLSACCVTDTGEGQGEKPRPRASAAPGGRLAADRQVEVKIPQSEKSPTFPWSAVETA